MFVWFDSLRPINNLSVKQWRVFLGWTSTKLGFVFAQGPQRSDAGEALTPGPSVSSQVLYHWATALHVAARLADGYSLTHKASFINKPIPRKPFNPQLKFTSQSRPFSPQSKPYSPQSGPKSNPSNPSINSSHSFTQYLDFLVKTKVKVLYPRQFAIIVQIWPYHFWKYSFEKKERKRNTGES